MQQIPNKKTPKNSFVIFAKTYFLFSDKNIKPILNFTRKNSKLTSRIVIRKIKEPHPPIKKV